ncbi:hypothetical protein HQ529_02345 [Candidatus Woesearchaeota archaeon]|nr:hypothetical protein [Candidatus Woesearchaeota archaeon]
MKNQESVGEKVDMETLHKIAEVTEKSIRLPHYLQLLGIDENLFNEKKQLLEDGYKSESGIMGILELLGLPIDVEKDIVVVEEPKIYYRDGLGGEEPLCMSVKVPIKKYLLRSVNHEPSFVIANMYSNIIVKPPSRYDIAVTIDDRLFYNNPRTAAQHSEGVELFNYHFVR